MNDAAASGLTVGGIRGKSHIQALGVGASSGRAGDDSLGRGVAEGYKSPSRQYGFHELQRPSRRVLASASERVGSANNGEESHERFGESHCSE